MSKNKQHDKKQNPPHYIKPNQKIDLIDLQKQSIITEKAIKPTKFKLGIDKNNNPIITIDNIIHFMDNVQFHAFTCGIINISKKINPEIDYISLFKNK